MAWTFSGLVGSEAASKKYVVVQITKERKRKIEINCIKLRSVSSLATSWTLDPNDVDAFSFAKFSRRCEASYLTLSTSIKSSFGTDLTCLTTAGAEAASEKYLLKRYLH